MHMSRFHPILSVFIYSCPGYKCPVKERMLYSSCKNPVVDQVKQRAGLEVAKTVRHVRVSAVAVEVGGCRQ